MFIFDRCLCSLAAATPVKWECDIQKENNVLMIMENWENNGMEEIVPPTPAYLLSFWPAMGRDTQMCSEIYTQIS